jgi:succinyl-diaminopimelate desuccinylase
LKRNDLIKDDEIIDLLKSLIRIPSENPPGNESRIAEFVGKFLADCGCEVTYYEPEPNRVSVVGKLIGKKSGPRLILNGHIDTKPAIPPYPTEEKWSTDPFVPTLIGERLYGVGACDMKGGIAALLSALRAFSTQGNEGMVGELMFQGAADEEGGSTFGTEYLLKEGVTGDMAIVAEATSMKICPVELGALWLTIHVRGERGHASMPWGKVNAIDKMIKVIAGLKDYIRAKQERSKHHYFPRHPSLNLGILSGGFHPGVIPDGCSLTFDIRLLPGETRQSVRKEIEDYMENLVKRDPQLKLSYEYFKSGGAEPSEIDDRHPLVKVLEDSHREVTGTEADLSGFIGFSDAGLLDNMGKIPTVIFGPGDIEQAHSINEYVRINDVCIATRIYLQTIHSILKG